MPMRTLFKSQACFYYTGTASWQGAPGSVSRSPEPFWDLTYKSSNQHA